jgi:hypothetical protein
MGELAEVVDFHSLLFVMIRKVFGMLLMGMVTGTEGVPKLTPEAAVTSWRHHLPETARLQKMLLKRNQQILQPSLL